MRSSTLFQCHEMMIFVLQIFYSVTSYIKTPNFMGKRKRTFNYCFIDIQEIFRGYSGKIFVLIAYLKFKQLVHSRSLNNKASRICKVSVEALALDRAPLISRPEGGAISN